MSVTTSPVRTTVLQSNRDIDVNLFGIGVLRHQSLYRFVYPVAPCANVKEDDHEPASLTPINTCVTSQQITPDPV